MRLSVIKKQLFYLLIILLPTQTTLRFWPQNILQNGYRLDYLSIAIYLTDIILLLAFLFDIFVNKPRPPIFTQKKFLYISLFQLFQLTFLSFQVQQLYFLIKIFLVFYFFFLKLPNYSARKISLIFACQIILLTSLSLFQFFKEGSIQGFFYFLGERRFYLATPNIASHLFWGKIRIRPYALFSHPNALSGYILLISIYFYQNFFTKNSLQKKFKIFIISLSLITIYLCFSQNAFIALILIMTLMLFKKRLIKFKTHILTFALAFSFLMPLFLFFFEKYHQSQDLIIRNLIFTKIKNLSFINFLLGVGVFDFLSIKTGNSWLAKTAQPIHNSIWQYIISQGVIFSTITFYWIYKKIKKAKLKYSHIIILSAIFFLSSLDHFLISSQQNLLLLAFLVSDCFNSKKKCAQ